MKPRDEDTVMSLSRRYAELFGSPAAVTEYFSPRATFEVSEHRLNGGIICCTNGLSELIFEAGSGVELAFGVTGVDDFRSHIDAFGAMLKSFVDNGGGVVTDGSYLFDRVGILTGSPFAALVFCGLNNVDYEKTVVVTSDREVRVKSAFFAYASEIDYMLRVGYVDFEGALLDRFHPWDVSRTSVW